MRQDIIKSTHRGMTFFEDMRVLPKKSDALYQLMKNQHPFINENIISAASSYKVKYLNGMDTIVFQLHDCPENQAFGASVIKNFFSKYTREEEVTELYPIFDMWQKTSSLLFSCLSAGILFVEFAIMIENVRVHVRFDIVSGAKTQFQKIITTIGCEGHDCFSGILITQATTNPNGMLTIMNQFQVVEEYAYPYNTNDALEDPVIDTVVSPKCADMKDLITDAFNECDSTDLIEKYKETGYCVFKSRFTDDDNPVGLLVDNTLTFLGHPSSLTPVMLQTTIKLPTPDELDSETFKEACFTALDKECKLIFAHREKQAPNVEEPTLPDAPPNSEPPFNPEDPLNEHMMGEFRPDPIDD